MCLLDGEKAATDALQTASRLSRDFLSRKREQNNKFWMYRRYQEESISQVIPQTAMATLASTQSGARPPIENRPRKTQRAYT